MSEMLERVEAAIAQAAYPDVHPDFTDAGWQRMARAAVKALREPTDGAVEKMEDECGYMVPTNYLLEGWEAMIDGILAEPETHPRLESASAAEAMSGD